MGSRGKERSSDIKEDRRRGRIVLCLALLVLAIASAGAIEAASALFFHVQHDKFVFFDLSKAAATPEELADRYRTVYDRELGWAFDHGPSSRFGERPTSREVATAPDVSDAMVSVFGSSMAYGDEVADTESWPYFLSQALGRGVLNFGQTLYGSDQSVLQYEQKARAGVRTPIAILVVGSSSIFGDVNVYKKFYYPPSHLAFTKPRFLLEDHRLVLLPNPITSSSDRRKLMDVDYLARLGAHDYWFAHFAFPKFEFPYSRILLSEGFWRQTRIYPSTERVSENTFPVANPGDNPEVAELSLKIVGRFFDEAHRNGVTPVLLYMPDRREVIRYARRGQVPAAMTRYVDGCRLQRWACLFPLKDSGEVLGAQPAQDGFAPGGHYSVQGNRGLARWLANALKPVFDATRKPQ